MEDIDNEKPPWSIIGTRWYIFYRLLHLRLRQWIFLGSWRELLGQLLCILVLPAAIHHSSSTL